MWRAFAAVLGVHLPLIPLVLNFCNPSVILKRGIVGSFYYGLKVSLLLCLLDVLFVFSTYL